MADEESEVLIMKGSRNSEGVKIKLGNKELTVEKEIKYLSKDLQMYFGKHVVETQKKADKG